MAGVAPINVGVDNNRNVLTYTISEDYSSGAQCQFSISDSDPGYQKVVFEILVNGSLVASNVSKNFLRGSIEQKKQRREKKHYVVELVKRLDLNLNDYFE